jgi:probable rRNA maturation factor
MDPEGRQAEPHGGSAGLSVVASDRQRSPLPAEQVEQLVEAAHATLLGEGVEAGELTLSFVDPPEIEDLHIRFMSEPGPTDVLSFPMGEDGLLGDVVVCPQVAAAGKPDDLRAELRLLVVHGTLHVLGYDHHDDEERAAMWKRQERYSGVHVR